MKSISLSIIIPILNERTTVGRVIDCTLRWGKATEIIIIDDGSTDRVSDVLNTYKDKITVIRFKKNLGKSMAMAEGVRTARGVNIMFLDGDLVGLTISHLDDLIRPIAFGYADMAIGTRESMKYGMFWSLRPFGGERVMKRSELLRVLPELRQSGFGAELLLNEHFKNKRIVYIPLFQLSHMMKFEKYPPHIAMFSYVKEWIEVGWQFIWQRILSIWKNIKQ